MSLHYSLCFFMLFVSVLQAFPQFMMPAEDFSIETPPRPFLAPRHIFSENVDDDRLKRMFVARIGKRGSYGGWGLPDKRMAFYAARIGKRSSVRLPWDTHAFRMPPHLRLA
ncbi:unnamed protein product, partial [Mesorhabditis belari]|uniref:Uncharacterized protein n=1 Tax=Mesorhabditis belari TaxID=2138241 RepID=A0AAF3ERL5_9BILA